MLMKFKNISDNLTLSEYNAIVSLLRNNCPFSEQIKINNKKVTGEYGEYLFDLESTTILDTGILISNETMSSIGTVKLENPVFPHSEYIIKFNVYSIKDYNVFDDDTDGIIVTQLKITLENNVAVNIPFETLDLNNIIGFDAEINITHTGISESHYYELTTSTLKSVVGEDEEFEIIAHLSDLISSENLNNEIIQFYVDDEFIGTSKTNNDGIATLKTSIDTIGEYTIHTKHYYTESNSITVNVKQYDEINLISTENNVERNDSVTLSAQLLLNDVPAHISDVSVTFEVYDSFTSFLLDSINVLTDENGVASFNYVGTGVTDVNIIAKANNITSNQITIEDCIFYDKCTSQNSKWVFSKLDVEYNENGMYLSKSVSGDDGYASIYDYSAFNFPIHCEFDITSFTNSLMMCFEQSNINDNHIVFTNNRLLLKGTGSYVEQSVENVIGHYAIEFKDYTHCNVFKDGELIVSSSDMSISSFNIIIKLLKDIVCDVTIKNVKIKHLKQVDLTSSANILSYTDGDSAILTASLSTGQTGQVVKLYDKNDNYIADMTDNEDGTYSHMYESQGAGDIGFYAMWGMILSETYSIEDCIYHPKLDGSEAITILAGTTTFNDNIMVGGSSYLSTGFDNTGDWKLTADINITDNGGLGLYPPNTSQRSVNELLIIWIRMYAYVNSQSNYTTDYSDIRNNWKSITLTKQGNNFTLSFDNVTKSLTWSIASNYDTLHIGNDMWSNGSSSVKNIKVKPL